MARNESITALPERNLDVLRALAVLSVVACHVMSATGVRVGQAGHLASTLGNFGVYVFFVHTALVLMGSLEREGIRGGWIAAFYLRRAFRIYPLAIVAVLLVVATGNPTAGHAAPIEVAAARFPRFAMPAVLSDLALVQNLVAQPSLLGPTWTLPIELQMYVLLPVCFLAARRGAIAIGSTFVAFIAGYLIVAHPIVPFVARLTVFAFGPCFLGGVLSYFLMRRSGNRGRLPPWTLGVVIVVGAAYLFITLQQRHLPFTWLAPLGIGCALPFIRDAGPSPTTKAAHIICRYSYGIYLLHVPVIWLSIRQLHAIPWPIRVATFAAGVTMLPWLAYHVLERPMIDLGKRLVRARLPQADDAIALAPAP